MFNDMYPVPGETHPSIAQYWDETLDPAEVDCDLTDISESERTEKLVIACGATHSTWWAARSQPQATIAPLSAKEASLSRAKAPRELIVDALSAVWPKSMLDAHDITLSSRSAGFACNVVDFVQQKGNKKMDLGTALAQVATVTWVEGVLLTRQTDYCVRRCVVLPRPTAVGGAGSHPLERMNDTNHIVNPYSIFPRRLWDLVNNRVVDVDAFASPDGTPRVPVGGYWAISHSWTADMRRWMTPINNYRWPVPLPKGITFEDIRWEALRAGAVYCWLDVLCLRQRTMERDTSRGPHPGDPESKPPGEIGIQERLKEWSIDVPTIGNNYRQATYVLRYFNGLGRPLQLDGWGGPLHWLNRAWTLQETRPEHIMVNGAVPDGMPVPLQALVSMGSHEAAGTRQQMRQVLALLAHLIEDAEPEHLVEVSMLDVQWPIILQKRRNRWALRILSGMVFALIVLAKVCEAWYDRYHTDQQRRPYNTSCKIARLQRPPNQAMEDFLADLNHSIEAYKNIWATWVWIAIGSWAALFPQAIAIGWPVEALVQQQQLLQATRVYNTITRHLRRRWPMWFQTANTWSILRIPIICCSWVHLSLALTGVDSRVFCKPTTIEALKAAVLLGWYSPALWFRHFVWPQVVAVSSGAWWVLCDRNMRAWIVPVAIAYIVTSIGDGTVARGQAAWKRARSMMMGDPKAEEALRCSSILNLVCEMSRRHASKEVDKIAGLAYLMKCRMLPLYSETVNIEDAWVQLVQHLNFASQLELLFNFPAARDDDTSGGIVGKVGSGRGDVYSAYRSRWWIPTWKAVSSLRHSRDVELQCPTWPPRWLKDDVHASDLRTFYVNYAAFDCGTGALVVPVCPRAVMTTAITLDGRSGSRSYSVHVAGGKRTADFVHGFYCPHGYSLPPLQERDQYLLISHARDNQAGPLSWVVGKLISPVLSPQNLHNVETRVEFGNLCNTDLGARRTELHEYVRNLGLPHEILAHMLLVRKVGVLVTDDMRPFTLPSIGSHSWCAINIPVVFV